MNAKTTGSWIVIAMAVIGVLVVLFSKSAAVEAAYPVEKAKVSFSRKVLTRVKGLWNGMQARAENVRLRTEVASLAMEQAEIARVRDENARLRAALQYREGLVGTWVAAEVLSGGGAAAGVRKTLRVDKGSLSGIEEGAVASSPAGLVGRVVSVTPHTAEVLLVTDPALKVACYVEGADGVGGILSGGTDEKLVLRYFKDTAGLPVRPMVFTSGRGGVFPPGILVGTLLESSLKGAESLRQGEVQPTVDFATLEDVFIRCEK